MDSTIERFRRTMRRHEARALRLGLKRLAARLADARVAPDERHLRTRAEWTRSGVLGLAPREDDARPTVAFLYDRAAEACARLRAELPS